jgi:hypothetical protein
LNLPCGRVTYPRTRSGDPSLLERPFADDLKTLSSDFVEHIWHSREAIMDVNPDKLNTFIGKMLGDVGAAMNASLMLIGDRLGLYKTLAAKGPMNSLELAQATGTSERYLCPRMARGAGCVRLCRIRCSFGQILDDAGTGYGFRR